MNAMQTPQPRPQSKCPFCGKPHPPKQVCNERLDALAKATRIRRHRAGMSRGELTGGSSKPKRSGG
jgi:hypothetical protein